MQQREELAKLIETDECEVYAKKLKDIAKSIKNMPKRFKSSGGTAIAQLHYELNGKHWWIIEKDSGMQTQAFGLTEFSSGTNELGWINVNDLILHKARLDLDWIPITIDQLRESLK